MLGLGGYPLVSLAEARDVAFAHRKQARAGGDPLTEKRHAQHVPTVEEAAAAVLEQQRSGWRHARYERDWPRSLRAYAFPRIGAMPGLTCSPSHHCARCLVRERDGDDIGRTPLGQLESPGRRRLRVDEHRPGAMDQQGAEVGIPTLGHPEHAHPPAGAGVPEHQPQPGGKLAPGPEGGRIAHRRNRTIFAGSRRTSWPNARSRRAQCCAPPHASMPTRHAARFAKCSRNFARLSRRSTISPVSNSTQCN